jgi:hypothetical protein
MAEALTPEECGCVGDGITDDTAAFSLLITAQQASGRVIELTPAKIYLLNSWTRETITSKLIIRGNGAMLKGPDTVTEFIQPEATFDIEGVVFDTWNNIAIKTYEAGKSIADLRFRLNTVQNTADIPINIEIPCARYLIEKNLSRLSL